MKINFLGVIKIVFLVIISGAYFQKKTGVAPIRIENTSLCNDYKSVEDLFKAKDTPSCAVVRYSYSADTKIILVKATTNIDDLQKYSEGLRTFDSYAEKNKISTLLYVGVKRDWQPTLAPHFVKIKAIQYAFKLGYEWAVFSDMDSFVPSDTPFALRSFLANIPSNTSLVLQREPIICSCFHIWRHDAWSTEFLQRWWEAGVTSNCCQHHSFDQIAFWGVLLGLPAASLVQERWPDYCKDINNGFISKPFLLSNEALHSAPWNEIPEHTSFIRHTGSANWALIGKK